MKPTEKFSSRNVKDDEVRNFIMNLDGCKAVRDIPTDVLKQTMDIHLLIMTQIIIWLLTTTVTLTI